MIIRFLDGLDWNEAPESMEFALPYGELLRSIAGSVAALIAAETAGRAGAAEIAEAVLLYTRAPGIVNVMLNYKICVEHGLPLHPTVYYELKEARRYNIDHELPEIELANRLYHRSIDLARSALRLDPHFQEAVDDFLAALPRAVKGFVFTGIRDTYTWRGSNPALLERLADRLRAEWEPDIIVAAAHGSIAAGLLLAELTAKPLYFIRLSMFKRNDEEPIVAISDESWLYPFRERRALLYDEDVAGGRTLSLFAAKLGPLFAQTRTACSIRHAGSVIKPDFSARVWWD
ncbi:MAG: hypothetical protein ABFC75_01030 [Rectinema sp.]